MCRLPPSPSNLRLLAAFSERGLDPRAVHPVALPAHIPPALRSPGRAAEAGVLLCRLPSGTPASWLLPARLAERGGQRFLNRPSALVTAHDKPATLLRLAQAGLPVPPTLCVVRDGPSDLDALPGERFVVKPVAGASGHGVTVGLGRAAASACAAAFADASGPVLVQPLLGEGLDRRLFLVGERIVAAMERRPAGRDGRGNLVYGAQPSPWQPSRDEQRLALDACRALALDVAAVDLLVHDGRALVLEVNSAPGLIGIERATGVDVAGAIATLVTQTLGDAAGPV